MLELLLLILLLWIAFAADKRRGGKADSGSRLDRPLSGSGKKTDWDRIAADIEEMEELEMWDELDEP